MRLQDALKNSGRRKDYAERMRQYLGMHAGSIAVLNLSKRVARCLFCA